MKTLVTARNVVNTDEIAAWVTQFDKSHPRLASWCAGPLRKWIAKSAPAAPFVAQDRTGMPDWLTKALDGGGTAETVLLDEALLNRVLPVLDYLYDLITEKPDTKLESIGFDVAEGRARKWHEDMARKAKADGLMSKPVEEEGTVIVLQFPDGWTWRRLESKASLVNESSSMGHCVGKDAFEYYEKTLRAKITIYSLRNAKNVPHVTIEAHMLDQRVVQIKGRANEDVLPKYLPRVREFLKMHTWNSINFDGARNIREQVTLDQSERNGAWIVVGGIELVQIPGYSDRARRYVARVGGLLCPDIALFDVSLDNALVQCNLGGPEAELLELLTRAVFQFKLHDYSAACRQARQLLSHASGLVDGWQKPANDAARALLQLTVPVPATSFVASGDTITAAYVADTKTGYYTGIAANAERLALELKEPQEHVLGGKWFDLDKFRPLVDLQTKIRKLQAGAKVSADQDDVALLNSLMTALKQPDVAAIKAAYMRMKDKTEVLDSHMRQLGMVISGRAINGIGTVLMCTLPVKNLQPFRRYVFEKPNLLTCWTEMLTKPDHTLHALQQYGLDPAVVGRIVILLRNEFMRLIPTEVELEELELGLGAKSKIILVMKWSAIGHRIDAQRSKRLWSSL